MWSNLHVTFVCICYIYLTDEFGVRPNDWLENMLQKMGVYTSIAQSLHHYSVKFKCKSSN